MSMKDMLRIKEEINHELEGKTREDIIAYYNKSGEEFDKQMTEYKQKWAKEENNLKKVANS